VGDDVISEMLLMTDFVNLKINPTQSFRYIHESRMCGRVFIWVNIYTCINTYICTVFLKQKFAPHTGLHRHRSSYCISFFHPNSIHSRRRRFSSPLPRGLQASNLIAFSDAPLPSPSEDAASILLRLAYKMVASHLAPQDGLFPPPPVILSVHYATTISCTGRPPPFSTTSQVAAG
jgi:hypothetical protein